MTNATFEQPDYLCLMPCAWGRAKTIKEVYRICRSNYSENLFGKKSQAKIFRLSDQVDEVEVDSGGSFYVRPSKESGLQELIGKDHVRLVYNGHVGEKISKLPEHLEDVVV